jgi:tetratricopeptide (TPR) repeat protein
VSVGTTNEPPKLTPEQAEAIPHLQQSVELLPQDPGMRANLCVALSLAGRPQEAIPHAREAVALSNGQNPLILDLLGRLYGQAGRLPEAIETTRRALDVASQAGDERLAHALRARLSSYEAAAGGRPLDSGAAPAPARPPRKAPLTLRGLGRVNAAHQFSLKKGYDWRRFPMGSGPFIGGGKSQ